MARAWLRRASRLRAAGRVTQRFARTRNRNASSELPRAMSRRIISAANKHEGPPAVRLASAVAVSPPPPSLCAFRRTRTIDDSNSLGRSSACRWFVAVPAFPYQATSIPCRVLPVPRAARSDNCTELATSEISRHSVTGAFVSVCRFARCSAHYLTFSPHRAPFFIRLVDFFPHCRHTGCRVSIYALRASRHPSPNAHDDPLYGDFQVISWLISKKYSLPSSSIDR